MIAKKIAYNILISGGAKVLSIALALFGIGMLTRYLGPEGFGKYTITLAFFAAFSALGDMGLHSIATREISRENADEETILSKVFTLRVIISVSIFIFVAVFVWFLPYPLETRTAIFVAAAAFVFSSSYGFLNSLFQKHLAMDRVAFTELVGKVIQISIIVALVKFELPFIFSIIAIFIAMASNFVMIYFFSRSFIHLRFKIDFQYWKAFLHESYPMGISAIATFLYFKVDIILLSLYKGDYEVGVYGVAYKIMETLVFFPALVVGLVYPLFSRYIFTNKDIFLRIANTTLKFFILLIIPLIICVQFLAGDIITIIGGTGYGDAIPVLQIIIFALGAIFLAHLFTNIVIAGNLQKKLMFILLFAAAGNVIANIIFIPLYSYIAAAVVSVATELFVAAAALVLAVRKTPYQPSIGPVWIIITSALCMVAIYTFSPFNVYINTVIALAAYTLFIIATRIVTIKELRSLVKD